MSDCVFCNVSTKEDLVHEVIWEDDRFLALLSIQPVKEGHTLVIPKQHVEDVTDMSDEDYGDLMLRARKISTRLKNIFNAVKVVIATEGLSVAHAHVHLIPVHHKGDMGITNHIVANQDDLHRTGERIRKELLI